MAAALLMVSGAVAVVVFLLELLALGLFISAVVGGDPDAIEAGKTVWFASLFVDGLGLLAIVLTAIAFLAWLSRVVDNIPSLEAGTPRLSPRWAIVAWFIPLANLVVPYLVVKDAHERLRVHGGAIAPRFPVTAWWLAWVTFLFSADAGGRLVESAQTNDVFFLGFGLATLSSAFQVAAAVLAVRVVRAIQAREDDRARFVWNSRQRAAAAPA